MSLALIVILILALYGVKYIIMMLMLLPLRYWTGREKARSMIKEKIVLTVGEYNNQISDGSNKSDYSQKKINKIKQFLTVVLVSYTRYFIINVGYIPSHLIRNIIYKHFLFVDLADKATIYYGAEIRDSFNLHIGKGSIIGDKCLLDARNGIFIGENVNLSSNVSIYTQQHDHRRQDFGCSTGVHSKVSINNRVWIGPNVIILPGVTIGEGAVVGAGAVVTKDIEPYTINVGIPAKKIGERTHDLDYQFMGTNIYFY